MMPSPKLHDAGEDKWPLKIHAGCGGVYLRGYHNIDIDGDLAANNPEQLRANETDITDYYARLEATPAALPQARPTVADSLQDMTWLPYDEGEVDKIVAVQSFEHLSPTKAEIALGHWRDRLRKGGVLILSVPDMAQTIEWLEQDERRTFALRHLRGSLRTPYSRHWAWYTRETLAELLEHHGFRVQPVLNFHIYPAIVVRGVKRA